MASHIIFGYGSLMEPTALAITVPARKQLRPGYIVGFERTFSYWSSEGFTVTHLDVAGIPFSALNIHEAADTEARVNGVFFTANDSEFASLKLRENGYDLVETTYYDYATGEALGTCIVFASSQHLESYDLRSSAQLRYLQICLDGAKAQGEAFYQEFLSTTYIDGRPLLQIPDLEFAWLTPGPYQPS